MRVWIIDDDADCAEIVETEIRESLPSAELSIYETPMNAWLANKGSKGPDYLIIDLSAVGFGCFDPSQCYSPIATMLAHYPGAHVIINSAVTRGFANAVAALVKEACPDSVVDLVTRSVKSTGVVPLLK